MNKSFSKLILQSLGHQMCKDPNCYGTWGDGHLLHSRRPSQGFQLRVGWLSPKKQQVSLIRKGLQPLKFGSKSPRKWMLGWPLPSCFGGTAVTFWLLNFDGEPNLFLVFTQAAQLPRQSVNLHHQYLAISIFILLFWPRVFVEKMPLSTFKR